MGMVVVLRTGEMLNTSASGFAIMTTAVLSQNDSSPEIAGEFIQFLGQRHGLVKVCQEVTEGLLCHNTSSIIIVIFGIALDSHPT
jgi:hypothetical protein